jgi:hypothetical protein
MAGRGLRAYPLRQPLLPMCYLSPVWRSRLDMPAGPEASFATSMSSFSRATLEVACNPGITTFALVERKQPGAWRWAVGSAGGPVTHEGWETTDSGAKRSAVESLQRMMRLRSRLPGP